MTEAAGGRGVGWCRGEHGVPVLEAGAVVSGAAGVPDSVREAPVQPVQSAAVTVKDFGDGQLGSGIWLTACGKGSDLCAVRCLWC